MYTSNNISRLKENLEQLSKIIDSFGIEMTASGRVLNDVERYYNSHLMRVRAHLEGVVQLLDSYAVNPIVILPIAHIMRSMLTEFITAFYLLTFYDRNDKHNVSFTNELKLLDRDAYRSVLEWMKVEEDLHKYNEHLPAITPEHIELRSLTFREYFSDILEENGAIKSTFSIRSSSDSKFFLHGENLNKPDRIVSEKYKIDRLRRMEYFRMLDGYMLYKYFSQFYHESRLFELIIPDESADNNFNYLLWGFIPVYHMVDTSVILFLGNQNKYSDLLLSLKEELESIGQE